MFSLFSNVLDSSPSITELDSKNGSISQEQLERFNLKNLEDKTLDEVLTTMIKALQFETKAITKHLEAIGEVDEEIESVLLMLKGAEVMQMHLEFVLAVSRSSPKDNIEKLKEKFAVISNKYEKLNSKDDLTPVPAKFVAATMSNAIIYELKREMKKSFKKSYYGEVEFLKKEENLAWIKILTCRFELFHNYYPLVVTMPKDDLFCFEKSSPVWQDLYESATILDKVTEQEVLSSFQRLHTNINVIRILIQNHLEYKNLPFVKVALSHLKDAIYYSVQPSKAQAKALLHLVNPKVEDAFKPWKVAEHPFVYRYLNFRSPTLPEDEVIYLPRLFPTINKECILKEYQENTINKIHPMDPSLLTVPDLTEKRAEVLEDIFIEREDRIPVRIMGPENLNLRGGKQQSKLKTVLQKTLKLTKDDNASQDKDQTIVIHFHGGGFVALHSNAQKVYLTRWVKHLNLVHFSIDYRLAPENKYPDALDDVWQAYLWILNYSKTVLGEDFIHVHYNILGIENKKIIFAGDSAGGSLAIGLALRLIRAGLKPPHGIALFYPALSLQENSFSPSYFLSFNDSMLPVSIIKLITQAYIGNDFKSSEDPFLSPVVASDELLEKLPPVRIVAGSLDPLTDDSWRFLAKLKKLKKNARLTYYENLLHGYLSHQDLKNYEMFVEETCDVIKELIDIEA